MPDYAQNTYEPSHQDALLRFLRKAYGAESLFAKETYVRWLYEDGGVKLYLAWLGDEIVGQLASQHVQLRVEGREVRAEWGREFFLLPDHRRHGLGEALMRTRRKEAAIALTIDMTPAAGRLSKAVRDDIIEAPPVYMRPLSTAAITRKLGKWAWPLAASQQLLAGMKDRSLRDDRYSLEPVERFDERVDRIWEKARDRAPVLSRRDSAWLNWRFARYPLPGAYRLRHLSKAGEVVGCCVLANEGSDARLIDFLCEPEHDAALFACAVREARRDGAVALYCLGGDASSSAAFSRNGFFRRDSGWPIRLATHEPQPLIQNVRSWFLTYAESNASRPN